MTTSRPLLRRAGALGTALVLVLAAAACSDDGEDASSASSPEGALETVTVALDYSPNTNHAGVYLAQASGWYEEAGLDVEIVEPGAAGSLALLGSGQADVAFTYQEELVPARAQGIDVVGVAAVVEHNTSSLLTLAEDGVERPRDLEGKSYGGYGGPLEEALVTSLVECDGGDASTVAFAEVGEADYRAGLTSDQYDAVWVFDAWDVIRLRDIEGLEVDTIPFLDHTDCIPDWYTPLLAADADAIADRRTVLEDFLAVTTRGYQAAMDDPEAAADALLDAVPELDPELVGLSAEHLATRYAEDPAAWGRFDEERFAAFVSFLVEAGLIEEEIPAAEAFTNDLLPDA